MPINFMVAWSLSLSLRSSSSSWLSNFLPVTGVEPGLRVRGRRLEGGSGFFSALNNENPRQSNESDLRLAFWLGLGDDKLGEATLGLAGIAGDVECPKLTDCGLAFGGWLRGRGREGVVFLGIAVDGVWGSLS